MIDATNLNAAPPKATKTLPQKEIKQLLKKHLPTLKQQFKVDKLGIFGSYVRDEAMAKSDIDILVEFYEPIGWEFVDLQRYLEDVLESRVDLVTPYALKPQLKETILNSVIYV